LARVLRMPDVGAGPDEGVLAAWLVEESARFDAAQTIAYVETPDELFSVEAGRPGVLLRALVDPGTPVDAGTPIGVLGEVWEQVPDIDVLLVDLGLVDRPAAEAPPVESLLADGPDEHLENGIDHGLSVGSHAARVREDALASTTAQSSPDRPPSPFAVPDPLSVVAEEDPPVPLSDDLLEQAAPVQAADGPEVQHHYLRATVRVDRLVALAAEMEREGTAQSTVIDLVGRAVAGAHRQVPQVGVARLENDHAATPGIPVTHPGRFGVEEAAAVVPPGQAAALAVGALRDEPVVDGTVVVAGKVMTMTLSVRPGGVDDVPAARWLGVLVALLERPEWMVE
jgi:pyruvate dehydrogenase E2 component (dihydrolipoamide acetyltransferase)